MKDTDLAWAAGFIDGEGCIQIAKGTTGDGYTYYSLNLTATQLDPEPLEKLRAMFGGSIMLTNSAARRNNPIWRWQAAPVPALAALVAMLPYLTVKRREAELAIDYQQGKLGRGNHRGIAGIQNERNEGFRQALKDQKVARKAMAA